MDKSPSLRGGHDHFLSGAGTGLYLHHLVAPAVPTWPSETALF